MKIKIINKNILKQLSKRNTRKRKIIEKFPNFHKWINNEDYPTYEQLVELSKYFGIPFGYFFLKKLPKRKKKKNKKKNIIESKKKKK